LNGELLNDQHLVRQQVLGRQDRRGVFWEQIKEKDLIN